MANKIYVNPETTLVLKASGGDYLFDAINLASASFRLSARIDKGAAPKAALFRLRLTFQCETAPTAGRGCMIGIVESKASTGSAGTDGTFSESDQTSSAADKQRNIRWYGFVACDVASAATDFIGTCYVWITERYFQVAVLNDTGVNLENTTNTTVVEVTPVPSEVQ